MIGYLKAVKPFPVAAGANPAGSVTLLGGDANMDDTINILDLSYIAARYLQSGPVYAPVAPAGTTPDINGDGIVNILDLSCHRGELPQDHSGLAVVRTDL